MPEQATDTRISLPVKQFEISLELEKPQRVSSFLAAATTNAGRPVLSQRDRNNPDITFHAASNRLLITGLLPRPGDKTRVSLFSLNGKLLYAAQAGRENSIQVPRRMTGVVLARVEGQGYRVEKRIVIVR